MGGHSLMDWDPAKPPGDEPCGMVAGAVSLPKAMAVLRRIGRGIVNNSRHSTPPPHVPLKTEDVARVKNENQVILPTRAGCSLGPGSGLGVVGTVSSRR